MPFEQIPYTNFHGTNQDWMIQQIKQMIATWASYQENFDQWRNNLDAAFNALHDYVYTYFDNLDVQQEINNKLDQMHEDGVFDEILLPYFNTYTQDINNTVRTQNDRITTVETQVNNFLENTGTLGTEKDPELVDIRVGANSDVYPTAGAAVRGQVRNLENVINEYNAFDVFSVLPLNGNGTHNGVTFSFDHNKCTLTGATTESIAFRNFYHNTSALPANIEAGKTYYLEYKTSNPKIQFAVLFYDASGSGMSNYSQYTIENKYITIPQNAHGMTLRISVQPNTEVDTTVTFHFINEPSNKKLSEDINNLENVIKEYNAFDVFSVLPVTGNGTNNGVTFTFDHNKCTLTGATTESNAFSDFYNNTSALPANIEAGKTYYLEYKTSNPKIQFVVLFYDASGSGMTNYSQYAAANRYITIPQNAHGMALRINVQPNTEVDTTVTFHFINEPSNKKLSEDINNIGFLGLENYSYNTRSHNGVNYTWDPDRSRCHVVGTASNTSFVSVYDDKHLPYGVTSGDKIGVLFSTSNNLITCKIFFTLSDGTMISGTPYFTEPIFLTIPENVLRMTYRIYVFAGSTVDDYVTKPLIFKAGNQTKIPFKAKKPLMVSFIDDDTTTDDYVSKFYNACKHNGIVGSFAVCTRQYVNGTSSIEQLLNCQYNGFNLIPHCYEQRTYLLPTSPDYDIVRTRENYFQCLKDFNTLGIKNPQNMWIIPYGSHDTETINLAKDLGFDISFTMSGDTNNYLTSNNKYTLHRCGLSALANVTDDANANTTGSMARCKARIDELLASDTGGWAIFTTHFNEWDSETWNSTLDANGYPIGYARFNELVQYAISQGCDIVSMAQGAAYMKPIINRNFTMG